MSRAIRLFGGFVGIRMFFLLVPMKINISLCGHCGQMSVDNCFAVKKAVY